MITARPTVYAGIQMRSRLEADYAGWLDGQGITWEYEATCYAGPAGQWLPDFSYRLDDGELILTEVKPESFLLTTQLEIDATLSRMEVALDTEPDAVLRLHGWEYGNASATVMIMREPRDRIWHYHTPGAWWAMWPGMGQREALREALRDGAR